MKYKTQEFKGLDKEITELTGDKETSGTELNAVQIDCAMISPWDSSSTALMKNIHVTYIQLVLYLCATLSQLFCSIMFVAVLDDFDLYLKITFVDMSVHILMMYLKFDV